MSSGLGHTATFFCNSDRFAEREGTAVVGIAVGAGGKVGAAVAGRVGAGRTGAVCAGWHALRPSARSKKPETTTGKHGEVV